MRTLGRTRRRPRSSSADSALSDLGGTTPKFNCVLESGKESARQVRAGCGDPGEAAATRLLTALGFGADTVTLVERLRCHGCPNEPFVTTKVVEATGTQPLYERVADDDDYEEFEWVAVEQKFAARPIEAETQKGWAFFELDSVDPSKGGAPRAHVDALRLLAVFLAHWDNKAENQRLVCLSKTWPEGTTCREPFLLLQDVGSTFGPRRVDLEGWERSKVWEDRAACRLSMKEMPYGGATFESAHVSERRAQVPGHAASSAHGCTTDRPVHLGQVRQAAQPPHGDEAGVGLGSRLQDARARRSAKGRRVPTRSARLRPRACARGVSPVLIQRSGIDRPAGAGDRLEVQLVAVDLDQHEVIVAVVTPRDIGRRCAIARSQRAGSAADEVLNAALQLGSLIDVLVSRRTRRRRHA